MRKRGETTLLVLAAIVVIGASGCSRLPKITLPGTGTVVAPKDVGKPATLDEGTERTELHIPANSSVTVTKTEPLPKDGFLLPGKTEYSFQLPEPTDFVAEARRIQASTGTVDTTVATRRADNAARMPLLYSAIGALVAAGVAFWLKFPTPALLCAAASGVFLLAWGAAGLPPWFWMIGVAAIAIGAGLYFGYERAEKAKAQ